MMGNERTLTDITGTLMWAQRVGSVEEQEKEGEGGGWEEVECARERWGDMRV